MVPSTPPAGDKCNDSTSLSLLHRVRAVEAGAWERFVALYQPVVLRWCERAGLQTSDAADLTQDLFTTVLTKLGTFRHDHPGASFRGWLWTVVHNRVRLHFRRKQTQPAPAGGHSAFENLADVDDPDASTAPPETLTEVVRRALELIRDEFEANTWQAFWRVQVEEQPVASVAQGLGISSNAVYKARARVLRRLRDEFGELID